jgi:c-di-GMP-binding flagellar brake protein YcgR
MAMSDKLGKELRGTERHKSAGFAWFKRIVDSEDALAEFAEEGVVQFCDISQSGVGIILPSTVAVGAMIMIRLESRRGSFCAVGRIRHCKKRSDGKTYRAGIEFVIIPPTDQIVLERILAP